MHMQDYYTTTTSRTNESDIGSTLSMTETSPCTSGIDADVSETYGFVDAVSMNYIPPAPQYDVQPITAEGIQSGINQYISLTMSGVGYASLNSSNQSNSGD